MSSFQVSDGLRLVPTGGIMGRAHRCTVSYVCYGGIKFTVNVQYVD